jgi:eukaryotic-like serine/threonine-protein kinase
MSLPIPTQLPDPRREWEGRTIAETFPLQQYIGGSKDSAVFLTTRAGKKAALKLVPADVQRSQLLLSRWQEASQLSDPHLVQIFERGQAEIEGTPVCYAVMEYGEEVLSQILPHRALSSVEARELLSQVTSAISYIHSKGLVHSRVKPSNIVAIGEQIKISSDSIRAEGTAADADAGNLVYDAPELSSSVATLAADVWSLGVTLVESLTQRASAWTTAARGEPILREVLPPPFDDVARHCLQGDPQRRWKITDIANVLSPPVERKPATPQPVREAAATKRWLIPALAVLVVAVLLVFALRNRGSQTPPGQKATTTTTPVTAPATTASAPISAATGSSPGSVAHQELPAISPSARHTIQGTIRIRARVEVNPSGDVTDVKLDSAGPSQYFARLTSQAARNWKFVPAKVNGQNVASEWLLHFELRRGETRVTPTQTTP